MLKHLNVCLLTLWSPLSLLLFDIFIKQICKPYIERDGGGGLSDIRLLGKVIIFLSCKTIRYPTICVYDSNGPRSNEKADGRFRRVLGDGLAAEGEEDCHGYQTQGERRTCLRFFKRHCICPCFDQYINVSYA